jgi:hypothetical protein
MHLPPRQHTVTIHNSLDLATAFEKGDDQAAGLLLGKPALDEVRKNNLKVEFLVEKTIK